MKYLGRYIPDTSGINSLGGFSYQIKVFVSYMLSMDEHMQAEFETVDDVSVKKITPNEIDENEDKFRNLIISSMGTKAIQVKRTTITAKIAKQVLLNWILLEKSQENVTDYILFTDKEYENSDIVFSVSADDLYSEVLKSGKNIKATIVKVRKRYEKDKQGFIDVYNAVKSKYSFVSMDRIDDQIAEKCKLLFKKAGVNSITYRNRIEELLRHITFEIIKKISEKEPFIIKYDEMIACAEDICTRITDQYIYPVYSEFKKLNKIDFADLEIAQSREYKQLQACNLPQKMIETHLQYASYYQNICYQYLELNKISKIRDIEETTFDNFENVKFSLQMEGKDTPFQRLNETKRQSNSYADSDQIKYGAGIYLTREDEQEHQISWEDEDNAKA